MKIHNYLYAISFTSLIFDCQTKKIEKVIEFDMKSEFVETTVDIFNYCLSSKNAIFASNDSSSVSTFLEKVFYYLTPLYVFGVNENSIFNKNKRPLNVEVFNENYIRKILYPATSFILFVTSGSNLSMMMENIKDSIWWNHEALFLIINNNLENSCQMANLFLKIIWNFNILSAIYLCQNMHNELFIYTFNPFEKYDSNFWLAMNSTKYWTLLKHPIQQPFNMSDHLCSTLYYDKTKDLNGYNIRATVYNSRSAPVHKVQIHNLAFRSREAIVGCLILDHLNATVTMKRFNVFGGLDEEGRPQGPLKDVLVTHTAEITLNCFYLAYCLDHQIYPVESAQMKIISGKKWLKYNVRFLSVFNLETLGYITFSYLASVIILKFIMNVSIWSSNLEFLRIFVGAQTLKVPSRSSMRIFFITYIIVIYIFSSYIYSLLSSINTVPSRLPIIDSEADLIKSKFLVYGTDVFKPIIGNAEISRRYRVIRNYDECSERLLVGDNACTISTTILRYKFSESPTVHISKGNLRNEYISYVAREDWPLYNKFSKLLNRLNEGGSIEYFDRQNRIRFKKIDYESDNSRILGIDELNGSLYVLIGGYLLATLSLFTEMIVSKANCCKFKFM